MAPGAIKQNRPLVALFLALLAALAMWCYVDSVLIPRQVAEAAKQGSPRGNLSDLYPRWLGARELLLHGRDPYSKDVTREIQAGYYGRPLDAARATDPKDQQGFAYPVYVVFLLAPTVRLPFSSVQSVFRWLLVGLALLSVPLWFVAVGLRPSPVFQLVWAIAVLGSFPAVQAIKLQQLTLLVCALLAGAAAAWAREWLAAAGALLAVASIKPQLVIILAAWLVIWAIGNWRERQRLFWGFAVTMLLLVIGSELLLPGWIHRFRVSAAAYWRYTGGGKSVLDIALGTFLGKPLALLIVFLLVGIGWRLRTVPARNPAFSWFLGSILAVTVVVIPTYATYNQLLLLPSFILIVHSLPRLRPVGLVLRCLLILGTVLTAWPWVAAAALDLGLLFLPHSTVGNAAAVPLWPSLAVPVIVLGAAVLCGSKYLQVESVASNSGA